MKYRMLLAIIAALTTCLAISCNKPGDNPKQPANKGVYQTPVVVSDSEGSGLEPGQGSGLRNTKEGVARVEEFTSAGGISTGAVIHPDAMEAWNLVETSYLVIERRWQESEFLIKSGDPELIEQGKQLREQTNIDIDTVVFEVNETVEGYFKDAIEKDPENLNNLATYACYLKPRRRTVDGSLLPTDIQAFKLLEQAIEAEPDNALWYLLMIHARTSPNVCHNWFREYAEEKLAIQRWLPEIGRLFAKAESARPDNAYINYYNAILTSRFAEYDPTFPEKDALMREIRAGNRKEYNNFFFPPPLPPFATVYWQPILREQNHTAVFVDHWNQFSMYDVKDVDIMVTRLGASMSWPEDKDDIGELMLLLYQLGRTQPFDRSFFGLQLKLLQPVAEKVEPGSDDALALAEAMRYLNDRYQTVGNALFKADIITDPARVGVIGVHETELYNSHKLNHALLIQPHHLGYLERAGEVLGLDFELYYQPNL